MRKCAILQKNYLSFLIIDRNPGNMRGNGHFPGNPGNMRGNGEYGPKVGFSRLGDWDVRVDLSFKTYSPRLKGSRRDTFNQY